MKKIVICLTLLTFQNILISQIVPQLWNAELVLIKEEIKWVEKTTFVTEINEGSKTQYSLSKIEIEEDGKRKVTLYDKKGNIQEVNVGYFKDEFNEIYETEDGKELKEYDSNRNLISETWIYPDGSRDEKTFKYENNKLIEIIAKDEFDTAIEKLSYRGNKLSQITSIDLEGNPVMERKILYDKEDKIKETQRIQDGITNKTVLYSYDDKNRLVLKEEEKINRLSERKMPPEIYEYQYHENGILKEEKWTIYTDDNKEDIKYISISEFNEMGLEIKSIAKDFINNSEEIIKYEYKMRE